MPNIIFLSECQCCQTFSILLKPLRFTKAVPICFKSKYIGLFTQAKETIYVLITLSISSQFTSSNRDHQKIYPGLQQALGGTQSPFLFHLHFFWSRLLPSDIQTNLLAASSGLIKTHALTKTFLIQTLLKQNKTKTRKRNNTL